jgi:transglutaminase-like putative cysteine protease
MRYAVRHRTTFKYEQLVSVSHHVLHLTPRDFARQQCLSSAIDIEPTPTLVSEGVDYFGNNVQYLTVNEPHKRLLVESSSLVDVAASAPLDLTASPAWDELGQSLLTASTLEAYEFGFDSPCAVATPEVRAFAGESFPPARPVLAATMDLTMRIFKEFTYRGGVSDISTPVAEVLAKRQGVCQDFAHLEIACLRSLGLPARYISGYLLTHPPAGQKKLIGADASHAWLAIWCGSEIGWADFDPTNGLIPSDEHVTVGWGRDYGDVSPINGFILGGGEHDVIVEVDVDPAP